MVAAGARPIGLGSLRLRVETACASAPPPSPPSSRRNREYSMFVTKIVSTTSLQDRSDD